MRPAVQPASAPRVLQADLAAIIYIAGVVWLLARLVVGWIVSAQLFRRAAAIDDAPVTVRLRECTSAVRLHRPPRLFEAPGLLVPVTTGLMKPTILLPTDWRGWHAAKLDAVLVHELSHLARRDTLVQRLSLLYRALYWFSPFGWWLHRHLVSLGDCASDEAVLATGIDRVAYAQTLLEFFAAVRDVPRRVDWHVAMASGRSAERRVDRILNWQGRRVGPLTNLATIAIVVTLAPVVIVAASGRAMLTSTDLSVVPAAPDLLPAVGALPAHSAESTEPIHVPSAQQTAPVAPLPTLDGVYVGPPGRDDLAGRQLIVFLFDLRTLPDDDLERAADTASIYVDNLWRRAESGADIFHVAAVQTLGATLETIQDFTWDKVGRSSGPLDGAARSNDPRRQRGRQAPGHDRDVRHTIATRERARGSSYGSSVPVELMKLVDDEDGALLWQRIAAWSGQRVRVGARRQRLHQAERILLCRRWRSFFRFAVAVPTTRRAFDNGRPAPGRLADRDVGFSLADLFGGFDGRIRFARSSQQLDEEDHIADPGGDLSRPNDPQMASPLVYRTGLSRETIDTRPGRSSWWAPA